jgi:hypothetical protein
LFSKSWNNRQPYHQVISTCHRITGANRSASRRLAHRHAHQRKMAINSFFVVMALINELIALHYSGGQIKFIGKDLIERRIILCCGFSIWQRTINRNIRVKFSQLAGFTKRTKYHQIFQKPF